MKRFYHSDPEYVQRENTTSPPSEAAPRLFQNMEIPKPWVYEMPEHGERNPFEYFITHLGAKKASRIPLDVMDVFMQHWEGNTLPWSEAVTEAWCQHWWFDDIVSALEDGEEIRCFYRTQDIDTDRPITGMFAYYGKFMDFDRNLLWLQSPRTGNHVRFNMEAYDTKQHYLRGLIESKNSGEYCFVSSNPMDLHVPIDFYLVAYGVPQAKSEADNDFDLLDIPRFMKK